MNQRTQNITNILEGLLQEGSKPVYSLVKVWDGYHIRKEENGKTSYVSNFKNNKYSFVTDYTYAKSFSKKTADKHLEVLKNE